MRYFILSILIHGAIFGLFFKGNEIVKMPKKEKHIEVGISKISDLEEEKTPTTILSSEEKERPIEPIIPSKKEKIDKIVEEKPLEIKKEIKELEKAVEKVALKKQSLAKEKEESKSTEVEKPKEEIEKPKKELEKKPEKKIEKPVEKKEPVKTTEKVKPKEKIEKSKEEVERKKPKKTIKKEKTQKTSEKKKISKVQKKSESSYKKKKNRETAKSSKKEVVRKKSKNRETTKKTRTTSSSKKKSRKNSNLERLSNGESVLKHQNVKGVKYSILREVNPKVPQTALKLGIKGDIKVKVKFLVDKNGRVRSMKFYSNSGYGFEKEVKKALLKWKFKPATYEGKRQNMYFYKTFRFRLK